MPSSVADETLREYYPFIIRRVFIETSRLQLNLALFHKHFFFTNIQISSTYHDDGLSEKKAFSMKFGGEITETGKMG